ncbi:chlorohydrolase [Streptococcus pneumoniae]|nr:chlorohydrolase [Streptococcus pneumoniae]
MKIKEQTRKLAAGYSKHSFEVVDETDEVSSKRTDEVSSKHGLEVVDETDEVSSKKTDEVSSKYCFEVVDRTDGVRNTYLRQGDVDANIYMVRRR